MKVAILQSNYIPWRGYFDLIHDVDIFVLYDDVQYTKNDWRNRNTIYPANGPQWLTIPVGDQIHLKIFEVPLPDPRWQGKHLRTLTQAYAKAPFFSDLEPLLLEIYRDVQWKTLSELNAALIRKISARLGISTQIVDSRDFSAVGGRVERLLSILTQIGASHYISGPAAQGYLAGHETEFADRCIHLEFKKYPAYPEYPQRGKTYVPAVSVIDLIANVGLEDAPKYIWQHDPV